MKNALYIGFKESLKLQQKHRPLPITTGLEKASQIFN